jgi:drug/metabolite transporter (DMT)-like permease
MAQTKRKRRTKHRGTPAGTIEARGRTGRPPTPDERKRQQRSTARERRLNTPPTWKSSITRALLAAVLVFAFLLLTAKGKNKLPVALSFTVVALVVYIPAGYYLELFLYRRRMRKRAQAAGGGPTKGTR